MKPLVILACLLVGGCVDRAMTARSALNDTMQDCDVSTITYESSTAGKTHRITVTCEEPK